jgi:hypothetical protein
MIKVRGLSLVFEFMIDIFLKAHRLYLLRFKGLNRSVIQIQDQTI